MADFQKANSILKVQKGTVNPFSLVNDHEFAVSNTFIDEKLYGYDYWAFHPMDNTATVEVQREDVLKFLDIHQIKY